MPRVSRSRSFLMSQLLCAAALAGALGCKRQQPAPGPPAGTAPAPVAAESSPAARLDYGKPGEPVHLVICAAVGGRLSLVGGVVGTVLVYAAKTFFSEHFAQYWLYFIGALFILVVVFLPRGLAGALEQLRGARARRAEPA